MADLTRKTENLLNNSNFEQGGWDATTGTIPFKNSNSKRCRYSDFFSISSTIIYYDFKDLNVNIIMVDSNGISLGGSGFKTGIGSFALLNNTDKISLIIANTDTTQDIMPEDVQSKNISLDYGWVHSLRKLTTATEAVENPLYSDGTAITSYTIKGNTVQSGTPTPSNPITISGVGNKTANSFDINGTWTDQNGTHTISGNSITITGVWFSYLTLELKANTTYSIKFDNVTNQHIAVYHDNTRGENQILSTYTNFATFATGEYTTIVFVFYANTGSSERTVTYSNIMLVEGTYTSATMPTFEPYGYKIPISSGQTALNPIYLTEPLMKIGDTVDSLASSGTVTYNIGWIDLGTLDWETVASGNFHSTTIITDMKLVDNFTKNNAICTDFKEVTPSYVASTDYSFSSYLNLQRTPFVNKTGFEGMTAAQFKAAMSSVIMYYVKAEAATETVTAPSIPTTEGANTITVDTTVQPSEFTATWTGWHDSSVKEYDGSDWQ